MNTALMLEAILAQLQEMEKKLKKPRPSIRMGTRAWMEIYNKGIKEGLRRGVEFTKEEKHDIGRAGYLEGFRRGYKKGFAEAKVYADPLPDNKCETVILCAATS